MFINAIKRATRFIARSTVALLLFGVLLGFTFPSLPRRLLSSYLPTKTIVQTIPAPERSFEEHLLEAAMLYRIPTLVAKAIVHQESGNRMDSIRYEPGQVERARKITKASGEQLRMYSSSHCAAQVMGWHAPSYHLTWADLYNPQTCAEVSMKILHDCYKRHNDKKPLDKTYQALKCYNGSDEYARTVLNRIGAGLLETYLAGEL